MGFFAEIASEARRGQVQQRTQATAAPQPPAVPYPEPARPVPEPEPARPAPEASTASPKAQAVPETSTASPEAQASPIPATSDPEPAGAGQEPVAAPDPPGRPETEPQERQPDPPAIDLTPGAGTADDEAKRKAHEAAEAKRKAEFDAKQAEKRAKRQAALDRIAAMNRTELLEAATGRVAADTERLTRRNMKEAVAEHVQAKCREDAAFAMRVMDPEKSMVNCFKYINRKAQKYAEQEMKDQGVERTGVYGLDVPDGLVYQWAEDYFNDPDAKEDHVSEEKFVPRPYTPARKPSKAKTAKAKTEKPKPATEKPKPAVPVLEQMSLL